MPGSKVGSFEAPKPGTGEGTDDPIKVAMKEGVSDGEWLSTRLVGRRVGDALGYSDEAGTMDGYDDGDSLEIALEGIIDDVEEGN